MGLGKVPFIVTEVAENTAAAGDILLRHIKVIAIGSSSLQSRSNKHSLIALVWGLMLLGGINF